MTSDGTGIDSVKSSSGCVKSTARTTPMNTPSTPPMSAVMTASQRIMRLTCLRDVPMARSMPSSRVRSLIESTSVFTMPKSETMIASASSA